MAEAGVKPVVMLVTATITDRDAYGRYMEALVLSGLLSAHGALACATGPAIEYLEGDGPGEIAAIVRFPSAEAARAFWQCDAYREISELRKTAGSFRVGLWRMLPAA